MGRPAATEKKIRLNLELPERSRDRLEQIRTATEAETITEVIRRSLAIYNALLEIQESGCKVVVVNKDGSQETLRFL